MADNELYARIRQIADRTREAIQNNGSLAKLAELGSQPGLISPREIAETYYGSDTEQQIAAAREYAQQLMDEKKNINESWRATWTVPFTITPDYYESLSNKVPVNFVPNAVPQYSYEEKAVYMPHAMGYISQEANKLGQENTEEYLRKNNLIQSDIDPANVLRNLEQEYKGGIEHEVMHSVLPGQTDVRPFSTKQAGYMGSQGHLALGLSQIQREHYQMTGSRLGPQDFIDLVKTLATSENPEDLMQGYSTEAKRALRAQISNAKPIVEKEEEFKKEMEKYEALPRWRKFLTSPPKNPWELDPKKPSENKNIYFLESSAKLIPALVSTNETNRQTV